MRDTLFFVLLSLPFLAVLVAGYGGYKQKVSTAVKALVLMIGVPGAVLTAAYFLSSILGADDPDARVFFMLVLMGHLGAVVFMLLSFSSMWRLRNVQERRKQREKGVFASKRGKAAPCAAQTQSRAGRGAGKSKRFAGRAAKTASGAEQGGDDGVARRAAETLEFTS